MHCCPDQFILNLELLTDPPQMALTFVAKSRVFLPNAKTVSTARADLARVQPLKAVKASKFLRAGTGVSVRYEFADSSIGTGIGVASSLKALGT